MKKILILILLFYCTLLNATVEFSELVSPKSAFWHEGLKLDELKKALVISRFRWVEEGAKMNAFRNVTILEMPVSETIIIFDNEKPTQITFSVYNKGDDDDIEEKDFFELYNKICDSLTKRFKLKPQKQTTKTIKLMSSAIDKDNKRKNANTDSIKWQFKDLIYDVSAGYTGRKNDTRNPLKCEYIKLEILRKSLVKNELRKNDVKKNVEKNSSGDSIIKNVPMVDQGQKGYCVVSTLDRILKYYNIKSDQNYLAQLASSDGDKGTSSASYDVIKKASSKLGFKMKIVNNFSDQIKMLEKLVKEYNKNAKRAKVREVLLTRDIITIMQQFSDDVVLAKSVTSLNEFRKFKNTVKNNVENGIPIGWSLILGIVPEEGLIPQNGGGHMRLIIGYNYSKTGEEELIFSDSWGRGHEEKRIKLTDAFAVTTGVIIIEP